MANASVLLGTFARAHDDQHRRARWTATASRISTVLMALAIVAICVFALRQLWVEWQTAAAQPLLAWLIGLGFGMMLVVYAGSIQTKASEAAQTSALRQRVQVVRHALLAGDTQLAPLAAAQPEPWDCALSGDESLRYGRLHPLIDTQLTLRDVCGSTVLTFGVLAALVAALLIGIDLTQPQARNNPPPWLDIGSGALAVVLLGIGIPWTVRKVRGQLLRRFVEADALGLRWVGRPAHPRVLWGDVRAFYTVTVLSNLGEWPGQRLYVLDGGDQVIAWQRSDSRFHRTLASSDQLAGLIAARTGLPLRDLTLAFERATEPQSPGSPQARSAIRERMLAQLEKARERGRTLDARAEVRLTALVGKLAPPDSADSASISAAVRQALGGADLPTAPPKSAAGRGCMLLLAAVVASALLAGAAWGVQQAQARYLAGLPAQIHAKTPLYADSLAAPDGTWLVSGATATGIEYQGQSYRLTGTAGNPVTSWTSATYGDVAVQVTARQLGGTQEDGIGLILRSNAAGDDYVAFVISPTDGGWTLWQYHPMDANADDDWHYLAGGDSSAVRKGYDATNTLLAITRGQSYVLYVNSVFVGAASDGDPDVYGNGSTVGTMSTPHQGHAGVYLADGVTTGVFTDFAVYRVQLPTSLWYV